MKKDSRVLQIVGMCILALSIPVLLVINGIQSRKYSDLENQVLELEKKQRELIEQNKQLITDISILSSSDRIEKIAREQLNMHQAETEEIVRIEMKESKK